MVLDGSLLLGIVALFFGASLVWAAVNIVRVLTSLVRPQRPGGFAALHLTAVWTVGAAAIVAGLAMLVEGLRLLQ